MGWNEPDNKDRDPWDGHSNLDEFLAQLKKRWEQRFGGGGPGSGRFRPRIWWFVVAILIGVWLLSGVYEVGGGDQAVLLRFGGYLGTTGAGVHWHWPWPITETHLVNVKEKRAITRNATLPTQDDKLVSAALTVKYHIDKPYRYLYSSASPTRVLDTWTDGVLLELVQGHVLHDLQQLNKSGQSIELDDKAASRIASIDPGIKIESVVLSRLQPPEEVTEADQNAESHQKQAAAAAQSAESAAQADISKVHKQADKIVANAKRDASQRLAQAQAEVARFQALVPAWENAPHVTESMLRNEALRDALTSAPKIIVSGSVHTVTLPRSALSAMQASPARTTAGGTKAAKPTGGRSRP